MKEAIRKFIIEKAEEIFKKYGYEHASVDEIAEVSQISKPTLYKYFKSKKDIFIAVLENMNKKIDSEILEQVSKESSLKKTIITLIKKSILYAKENRSLIRIAFFDGPCHLRDEKRRIFHSVKQTRKWRFEMLKNKLVQAKDKRELPPSADIELITIILAGTIKEIMAKIIFEDTTIEDPEKLALKIYKIIFENTEDENEKN